MRKIVIEYDAFAPSVFVVAGLALAAEFAFMRIVFFVARHASGGVFVLVKIAAMAAIAFGFGVFAA